MTTARNNAGHLSAWQCWLCVVLAALAVLWCEAVFFHYATNAGQADDFVDVLWFFEIFRQQAGWPEKMAVLFLPNHEHVTFFNHLVYVLHYAVTGELNFFHYMVIGQLIIIACAAVLVSWLRIALGWSAAMLLAFAVFMNLFYWHAGFWAMTALSNQGVILFALLAMHSAARNPQAIFAPLCWSLAAVLTQFNGLLVLPALLLARLAVSEWRPDAQQRLQLTIWMLVAVLMALVYVMYENPLAADHLWRFVGYTDPGNAALYFKPTSPPVQPPLLLRLAHVPMTWLVAAGSTVFDLQQWLPALLVGAVMCVALLYAWRCLPVRKDFFWCALLLFVLLSLLLVAGGRGFGFGPLAGLQYRYRLYTSLLLVLLLVAWLRNGLISRRLLPALLLALLVQFASLHVVDDIAEERHSIQQSHHYWLVDGGMGRSSMPFYPHNQDWRLFNAFEAGYYNPYEALPARNRPAAFAAVDAALCEHLSATGGQSEAVSLQAFSKKSRALAVELSLIGPVPASQRASLLFCDGVRAWQLDMDARNIDAAASRFLPVLVLKKQLPPATYHAYYQTGAQWQSLGLVSFP